MPVQLTADALLVIAQWKGRPDAVLHVIHDVCVPAGRIADHSLIPAVEEVREAGLTDVVWDGHVLTDAGKDVLAALPPVDDYDAETALAVLARIEPPLRDPSDPVVRWVAEFLGLPDADPSAPRGVLRGLPEAPGEPRE
ncbi:hypothetical protein [Methylorubrum extorquens]|uniref:Uncharacterized protein n=1 Tax=Methylorubrum extorquens (strain ATCC 14718 / DSM 1338 / JCM 2805 / NCIMB 9133 / AM1) TaxID=272630 RepID=C5B5Y4_METEA|nr:hypothetical protein [Methylorubrum extorquens]ACS43866.1 Hypothetical protein MexAM1_META2p1089 [Methylorubrum extorquens AM1]MCP1546285.1 hypothetical protein [Methylorubrum extorquens]MCP1590952.1 hypothetical protein [Methylorubrum extorquens]